MSILMTAIGVRQEILIRRNEKSHDAVLAHLASLTESLNLVDSTAIAVAGGVAHQVDELKTMHEHSDDFGFGTKETNRRLSNVAEILEKVASMSERSARTVDQLVHYVQADYEARTGNKLPPYVETNDH
jgi:methyl-accepting chemotaxis protein